VLSAIRSFAALIILGSVLAGTPSMLAQVVSLPALPQVNGPFTLKAVTDTVSGKSHFRYNGSDVPPTMRVRPGQELHVGYVNELSSVSTERCVMLPCSNGSNLHFHGLHVSPESPQDDVPTMSAALVKRSDTRSRCHSTFTKSISWCMPAMVSSYKSRTGWTRSIFHRWVLWTS
jgi:FtsP/CotA-like multicopper oxidase with cupredoxin domain